MYASKGIYSFSYIWDGLNSLEGQRTAYKFDLMEVNGKQIIR